MCPVEQPCTEPCPPTWFEAFWFRSKLHPCSPRKPNLIHGQGRNRTNYRILVISQRYLLSIPHPTERCRPCESMVATFRTRCRLCSNLNLPLARPSAELQSPSAMHRLGMCSSAMYGVSGSMCSSNSVTTRFCYFPNVFTSQPSGISPSSEGTSRSGKRS